MFYLLIIFATGILHGLGPDHLAAITAFGAAAGHDFRRMVGFAVRFAAGHAIVIGIAGLLARFGRNLIPPRWENVFEYSGGGLLVVTGLALLLGLLTGRIQVHAHFHGHDHHEHRHFHMHLPGRSQHEHVHGSTAVALGALFALGGARSLILVVPMALASTLVVCLLRIAVFVVGIIISMVAYAFVTQFILRRISDESIAPRYSARLLLASSYLVAFFCIAAGLYTIHERFIA